VSEDKTNGIIQFPALPEAAVEPTGQKILSKETLIEYQEDMLVRNARKIIPTLFKSLKARLEKHDSKAAEQVMSLYGYTKASPGVVINNMLAQQINGSGDSSDVYFEQIIKKLEQQDRPSGDRHGEIVDAEVVE
jgi:acyl-CoA synthetase (AMP-forming)/AMP-acid ligase II